MKLQKLIYYAHGWHLASTGKPLIDESVEAWKYGPVIPSVYHEFKSYGSGTIREKGTTIEAAECSSLRFVTPTVHDSETKCLLDTIWEAYGGLSGVQLSNLTHKQGTPWSETFAKSGGQKGFDIPNSVIKEHFDAVAAAV